MPSTTIVSTFVPVVHPTTPEDVIGKQPRRSNFQFEVKALQPKRELSPEIQFFIGAKESCTIVFATRIYADTLAQPSTQELKLRLNVDQLQAPAIQVFNDIIRPAEQAAKAEIAKKS